MSFSYKISGLIRHLLFSYLMAITVSYLCLPPSLKPLTEVIDPSALVPIRVVAITLLLTVALSVCDRFFSTRCAECWGMVAAFAILSVATIRANAFSVSFLAACLLVETILIAFALRAWNVTAKLPERGARASRIQIWVMAALALLFCLLVSLWTVCRVLSFNTPTYDFGIFSQMFHSMKTSGLPMTTLERDGLLSHFRVHVSPIYYLMLPFYILFPYPATLQVLQALIITSAVIPLWLLGRHHGLTGWQRVLLCTAMLLYPAFAGGTSYDLHENCFLAPLILWLFLGIDRKSTLFTLFSALLILSIKEDAAVYVAIIALWLFVRAILHRDLKDMITGIGLFALSLLCFLLVTDYLAQSGDGVMVNRYQNLMPTGTNSLWAVVQTALLHPLKVVYECVDPGKITFIVLTFLPLLGIPLLTRRFERYLLLIPYILVNLMTDYVYQHDIFFQYTFGSVACLFYLVTVNLSDIKNKYRLSILVATATVCCALFYMHIVPRAMSYPRLCVQQQEYIQDMRQVLDTIPEEASVTASTFLTTYLSQRDVIYDLGYASRRHLLESEYVVIDLIHDGDIQQYATAGKKNGYPRLIQLLHREGYEVYAVLENTLLIFRKAS